MATATVPNKIKLAGGSFLIDEHATDQVFTAGRPERRAPADRADHAGFCPQ